MMAEQVRRGKSPKSADVNAQGLTKTLKKIIRARTSLLSKSAKSSLMLVSQQKDTNDSDLSMNNDKVNILIN
jgi:hypothetical protein